MTNESGLGRRRRWIRAAILVLIAGALLALAACACLPTFRVARIAQNAADGAALAGASQLVYAIRGQPVGDDQIAAEMLVFANHNGLGEDDHLIGYYLDAECDRLGQMGSGMPQDPRGIEAVVTVRVRIFGLDSWSITRQAESCLQLEYVDGQVVFRRVPPLGN